jgi:glycogen operon protein
MLAAGDELGRTQHGNNNAYNRDDEVSWVDWRLEPWQHDLLATTTYLLRLRREHPALRQRQFFGVRPPHADGIVDLGWFGPDGRAMDDARWHDPHARVLQSFVHWSPVDGDSLLLVLCGAPHDTDVALPGAPWATGYQLLWDSADERPAPRPEPVSGVQRVRALSLRVYRAG